ncbi:MAG: hypothetical protein LBD75_05885 [Candidatus Peribacteria bacterium]|jgi:hypothetical protein|nr:hypothetical protein [Candidatus Peribacteria bacterium]
MFAFSGDTFDEMVGMVMQTGNKLEEFLEKEEVKNVLKLSQTRRYLSIVNTSSSEIQFSLTSSQFFALSDSQISVQAHYGDTEVGLEAKFSEPFPNFLQSIVSIETTDEL